MISRRGFCVLLPGAAGYFSETGLGASSKKLDDGEKNETTWSFASPPESARPYVLWMWMGSNVSSSGITKDLEAMKEAGIGGATIFSLADSCTPWAGFIGNSPTPDVVTFTEPWWRLVRHAAAEAHRLGLELILHNCAGYESSGGPWITPEFSMQEVVWSATPVQGGALYKGQLPRAKVDPHPHAQFPKVYIPELGRVGIPIVEARNTYYRDIAVMAVPAKGVVEKDAITLLHEQMSETGEITWDAPVGEWIVYRFGHTTTGAMIQPAQWGAMGLECDKMSREAVTFHIQHVLGEMKKHLGDLMGKGVTTLYFDSYEAGTPTWTPKMREEFSTRRGYDLTSWLPVFAGRQIASDAETKRFHEDFKRTVEDLYRDHYWATPGPLAHDGGLKFVAEPYEGPWRVDEVVKFLDIPTVEFWTHNNQYSPVYVDSVVKAARASGHQWVASEAFTTSAELAHWKATPAWLKPIGDAAFCDGIARMNLHHFVQQPWDEKYQPGNTMGQWGVHFGRNQTWWKPGNAWLVYLWRCQNLLQRGEFVPPAPGVSMIALEQSGHPEGEDGKAVFRFIQRQIGDASVFFIANTSHVGGVARIQVPIAGKQPEAWDPVWGTMRELPEFVQSERGTELQIEFAPAQSLFLVFRRKASRQLKGSNIKAYRTVAQLEGSWHVSFDPEWGGPASTIFPALTDWITHEESGIRYYSGTAVYRKRFRHAGTAEGEKVYMDLGECHHLAEVSCNGKKLGVVWTAPWRIEITGALQAGDNELEIAVTNVWANRLIGDEQQPPDVVWEDGDPEIKSGQYLKSLPEWFLEGKQRPSKGRYTFATWNYFKRDSPLVPSGLIGPVQILAEEDAR